MTLTSALKAKARDLGFDLVAIAPAGPGPDYDRYLRWVEAGYAGEMGYLARHAPLKADPRSLLPDARSLVMVGLSYAWPVDPALRADPSRGQIAAYALGDDYHHVMRQRLIELDEWLRNQTGRSTPGRACVDSAPLLERSWAMQASLGFIGKNTCLIHPGLGSWLFLGALLVPEALEYDEAPRMINQGQWTTTALHPQSTIRNPQSKILTCGRCTRCLDACPTGAFVSAYTLDARRCISYLTIELRGEIPLALRPLMGNWVFGCDLCQDVCPWNRRVPASSPHRLLASSPPLLDLLTLDRDAFAQRFDHSPVLRARWEGFMRNVCVAAGNWGDPAAAPALTHHLRQSPPLVASHAAWALGQLRDGAGKKALSQAQRQVAEPVVLAAIAQALNEEA